MTILKHGDLKPRHFSCDICGCKFVADLSDYEIDLFDNTLRVCSECSRICMWIELKDAPLFYESKLIDKELRHDDGT